MGFPHAQSSLPRSPIQSIDAGLLDELMLHGRTLCERADRSIADAARSPPKTTTAAAQLRRQKRSHEPTRTTTTTHAQVEQQRRRLTTSAASASGDSDAENAGARSLNVAKKPRSSGSMGEVTAAAASTKTTSSTSSTDLAAILAEGRARLERADRTIKRFYCGGPSD